MAGGESAKPFAWRKYLEEASRNKGQLAYKRYAYVSLFGINSLEDLKASIFQNTVGSDSIGKSTDIRTMEANVNQLISQWRKGTSWLPQLVPKSGHWTLATASTLGGGIINTLSFFSVTGTLICIDDIERRGDKLSMRDVLGLISSLKDLKKCKIFIIMNADAEDKEKDQFQKFQEKVVDKTLVFDPTPLERINIILGDSVRSFEDNCLSEYCNQLEISNIRVLQKIRRSLSDLTPLLSSLHEGVTKHAIHTITLLSWIVYEPDNKPTLEFLASRRQFSALLSKKDQPKEEAGWNSLLDAYKFTTLDRFDECLLDGIINGFFDEEKTLVYAKSIDSKWKKSAVFDEFKAAWDLFHDSFKTNGDEVVQGLEDFCYRHIESLGLSDLDGVLCFFKEMNLPNKSAFLLDKFMSERTDPIEFFDYNENYGTNQLKDTDLRAALDKKLATVVDDRDFKSVLMSINGGWYQRDIEYLSRKTTQDYYQLLMSAAGDEKRQLVRNCLQFSRYQAIPEEQNIILTRAREALEMIGQTSRINMLRVNRFGVTADQPPLD